MLVKILDMQECYVDMLKEATGSKTASGAVEQAAIAYLAQKESMKEIATQCDSLQRRLDAALRIIEGARSAAALLLEKTGQRDLLD
ncbi:hypothetical protein SAMN05444064_105259 [Pseudomonas syringae]|uniref:hypothetical protein n=1 Tax=Pseudomonas syringae TaxID=317 RepID=UPI0008995480|nr:hypothetical protein [Pseudomonas syringae]SDW65351.1 hypothetical protein SAMN05444514_105249 [Pseudomonas syringae]SDW65619.1 hypothetical protein SAMN05444514_105259 [Pseudomonas syringae]SFL87924.1 hypothetical protein SAMN05444064_105249 [Pseudomonas syringae]SFL88165.1 hypothetical protein SAMN05444064_105259 [Pseudomonas syringae]